MGQRREEKKPRPAGLEPTASLSQGVCSTAVLQPLPKSECIPGILDQFNELVNPLAGYGRDTDVPQVRVELVQGQGHRLSKVGYIRRFCAQRILKFSKVDLLITFDAFKSKSF